MFDGKAVRIIGEIHIHDHCRIPWRAQLKDAKFTAYFLPPLPETRDGARLDEVGRQGVAEDKGSNRTFSDD
jgi:hypothetical protein